MVLTLTTSGLVSGVKRRAVAQLRQVQGPGFLRQRPFQGWQRGPVQRAPGAVPVPPGMVPPPAGVPAPPGFAAPVEPPKPDPYAAQQAAMAASLAAFYGAGQSLPGNADEVKDGVGKQRPLGLIIGIGVGRCSAFSSATRSASSKAKTADRALVPSAPRTSKKKSSRSVAASKPRSITKRPSRARHRQ